jgi:hypothetical protein
VSNQVTAVDLGCLAISFKPLEHRGSRNVKLAALLHDRFIERLPLVVIIL